MKNLVVLFLIFLYCINLTKVNAQTDSDSLFVSSQPDIVSIGFGAGLDYGGFGRSLLIYPQNNVGLFAGGGYALAGPGYNVGAKIRFTSRYKFVKFSPYLLAMYGYNAAIKVSNATKYNKLFFGPTIGVGVDHKSWPGKSGYWSFSILVPLRKPEVDEYIDDLKNNHGVEFKNELIPIGFSIGYRFILN